MFLSVPELMLVFLVAVVSAAVVLFMNRRGMTVPGGPSDATPDPIALLFEDGVLYHATNRALRRFAFFPGASVWDDLRDAVLPRFPDFPEDVIADSEGAQTILPGDPKDTSVIELTWRDGMCWVEVVDRDADEPPFGVSADTLTAQKVCCDTMSHPVWEELPDGRIGWRNAAYDSLQTALQGNDDHSVLPPSDQPDGALLPVSMPDGSTDWYEVTTHRKAGKTLHHAHKVTDVVQAKETQGTFVQALAKTFAHLSIGLAIFDRNGQLNIFNPSLVDLTGLQPAFLATQPTMLSFFDALRENRRMPEPKNYGNWRQEITDMIAAASDDDYRETWTLEDGRTYAVQGRPHPEGATAFLIEDISSEVTLNRNFRIEVEQYEALLDHIDAAVTVFSSSGVLTFCNAAYRNLWGHNPEAAFADVMIKDAISVWQDKVLPTPSWGFIENLITTFGNRDRGAVSLSLKDGSKLLCQLIPIGSGATMVRFTIVELAIEDIEMPPAPTD